MSCCTAGTTTAVTLDLSALLVAKSVTVTTTYPTGSGSVPAGSRFIYFLNDSLGNVTVNGRNLPSGAAINFPALGVNELYPAISYDGGGNAIRIDVGRSV